MKTDERKRSTSKRGSGWRWRLPGPTRIALSLGVLGLGLGAVLLGYQGMRADVVASVYRERLESIAQDYDALRTQYNEAVRRTAVTELLVEDGALSVRIRTAAGVLEEIPTAFDPSQEVFIDYAVVDGRLWIRRVYDGATPPNEALVVTPALEHIDWDGREGDYGQAVYRSLSEGRWAITVSGDGALGLGRVPEPVELAPAPSIRRFEEIEAEASQAVADLSFVDLWRWLWGAAP